MFLQVAFQAAVTISTTVSLGWSITNNNIIMPGVALGSCDPSDLFAFYSSLRVPDDFKLESGGKLCY